MGRTRAFTASRNRVRNLEQYQDMSDDEFETEFQRLYGSEVPNTVNFDELDKRIQEHIEQLGEDYDLDDMKINDKIQLRELVLSMIQVEDLEMTVYEERQNIDPSNIIVLEKLNKMLSTLKSDISNISEDLQLTKRARDRSQSTSVVERWKELSQKAHEFYKRKMLYIFCTKCRMLLSTVWLNYTECTENMITLKCERCGNQEIVHLDRLYATDNKNLEDVIIP
jgi:RNase P subunit RPR2